MMIGEVVQNASPTRVQVVFAPNVKSLLHAMAGDLTWEIQLITQQWTQLPQHQSLLEKVVDDLAEVALALWPNWYGGRLSSLKLEGAATGEAIDADTLSRIGSARRPISLQWMRKAARLCGAGRCPKPSGFTLAIHATQLALTISPSDLALIQCIEDEKPSAGRLLGFARACEWLATTTGARVVAIVPSTLSGAAELDAINFNATTFHAIEGAVNEPLVKESLKESKLRVWPVIGQPHPFSPGEQLLASALVEDKSLGGLFSFNEFVFSRFNRAFLVDLLWQEGKVIVEIDGYQFHTDPHMFVEDRQRDYELLVSDYLVLRITHDEVISDVDKAVGKIRSVVEFRDSCLHPSQESCP